jgi:ribose transport system substrate-binding protein
MVTRRSFLKTAGAVTAFAGAHQLGWPTGARGQKTKKVIVMHTKNLVNPFWKAIQIGATKSMERWKDEYELVFVAPTKPDNIDEQSRLVEDWITKKPAAMMLIPVDYVAMVPVAKKAMAAGIPIINFNNRMSDGRVDFFTGGDDVEIAYRIATYGFKAMGGKGKVVILNGVPGSIVGQDRVKGFNMALKDNPGIELLTAQPANFARLMAVQVMENLLQRFPKIDLVITANDEMGLGAVEAIDAAGRLKDIKVTGWDALPPAIESIKRGRLYATLDFSGFDQGYVAFEAVHRYLKGETLPKNMLLPVPVVDKTNVQQFDIPVDQRRPVIWEEVLAVQKK